jgi:hypothetical protein
MTEHQPDHGKKQILTRFRGKLVGLSVFAKKYAKKEYALFKQDCSDISNALKIDKSVRKLTKKTWKKAPLEMRKKSHHISRLRAIPVLLAILFLIRIFLSTPSEVIFTIFSFLSLIIIGSIYYSYKLARTRAIQFSQEATEWIWEILPSDNDAELFANAYSDRNASDIIAPWIQTRSKIKDWLAQKLGFLKPS